MHGLFVWSSWCCTSRLKFSVLFFSEPATAVTYTLSLHDALPISRALELSGRGRREPAKADEPEGGLPLVGERSEEHTSELQSLRHLVCRLLLEKKTQDGPVYDDTIERTPAPQPAQDQHHTHSCGE